MKSSTNDNKISSTEFEFESGLNLMYMRRYRTITQSSFVTTRYASGVPFLELAVVTPLTFFATSHTATVRTDCMLNFLSKRGLLF